MRSTNSITVFLILALFLAIVNCGLKVDVNSATYKKVNDYWSVNVPCLGGVEPLRYSYESLPSGWGTDGNQIKIPGNMTKYSGNTYPVRTTISDRSGASLKRTFLIKISGSGLFVGDYDYDYNIGNNYGGSYAIDLNDYSSSFGPSSLSSGSSIYYTSSLSSSTSSLRQ
jgi:hypothetical protein